MPQKMPTTRLVPEITSGILKQTAKKEREYERKKCIRENLFASDYASQPERVSTVSFSVDAENS